MSFSLHCPTLPCHVGPAGPTGPAGFSTGAVYYFNEDITGDPPIYKDLDRVVSVGAQTSISVTSTTTPQIVESFITPVGDPGITELTGGSWNYEFWADTPSASSHQLHVFFKVYLYHSDMSSTLISTTPDKHVVPIGSPELYLVSGPVEPQSIAIDDRFLVEIWTSTSTGSKDLVMYFNNGTITQVTTTLNPFLAGPTGPTGPTGPAGPAGAAGSAGVEGPTGPAGADGADGAIGPTGPTGPAGADGADGAIGPTGPAGADGVTGSAIASAVTTDTISVVIPSNQIIDSMTLTPPAGTYYVTFSADVTQVTPGVLLTIALYYNSLIIGHTSRFFGNDVTAIAEDVAHTQAIVVADGIASIEARANVTVAGTYDIFDRSLIVVKVA